MTSLQNSNTIIHSNLALDIHSRPSLILKFSTMKTYLLLSVFICTLLSVNAQNATKSSFAFNHIKGLNSEDEKTLDKVYHDMSDLKYHYFNLVSEQEMAFHQQPKLLKLVKARAAKVIAYYKDKQQVKKQHIFMSYGGSLPTLWLHKPVSRLTASGNITLEDNDRQCFNINPSIENTITSDNGNKYYFPPHAFVAANGYPVSTQNIDVCVWEFVDKKSLIYSGLTTDAGGKMLETAGSFFIEAKLNGEELQLAHGETYTVEMRAKKSYPDMFTYYGGNSNGLIDWTVNPNERASYNTSATASITDQPEIVQEKMKELNVNINVLASEQGFNNYDNEYGDKAVLDAPYLRETEQAYDFYEMSAGKLGWINCDRFYKAENTSTVAINVDSDSGMVVRLVFRDINSVMPCYSNSNHKDQYQASGIPVGEKVLVLAYSVKDENAVMGYKEIIVGQNDVENVTLSNLSKTRFKSAVSELLN